MGNKSAQPSPSTPGKASANPATSSLNTVEGQGRDVPKPASGTLASRGLSVNRYFTHPGENVYDQLDWTTRSSIITEPDGRIVFKMDAVEVPSTWSQLATDILASKYFRRAGVKDPKTGHIGPETTARQVVDRIVVTFRQFGELNGYFATADDAQTFEDELRYLLITQRAAFNSPVWFNVGHYHYHHIMKDGDNWAWDMQKDQVFMEHNYYARPQGAACFIQRVEDNVNGDMGIMELVAKEARLFKGGSGTGTNFSKVRGAGEPLSSGGKSSGLLSFLKILDANAGSIKSGGTTRRAAKMVILDVDHPDVEEFIGWKAHEEKKAKILLENGVGLDTQGRPDFNGEAYQTVSGQNSNNSIRVTDAFFDAVAKDADWNLIARTTKKVWKTVKARKIWNDLAQAAWECADPGVQYDDTIQKWNTCPNTDRINATNPCFPAGTTILTDQGILPIEHVVAKVQAKEPVKVYTSLATQAGAKLLQLSMVASQPVEAMMTGVKETVRLTFSNGVELRCTPNHKVFTVTRGMVPAEALTEKDEILFAVEDTAFGGPAEIPISSNPLDYNRHYRTRAPPVLPKVWSAELGRLLGHLVGDGCISKTRNHVAWVYGNNQEWLELGLKHEAFLDDLGFHTQKHEMKNGTVQLVVTSKVLREWLLALGMKAVDSHEKRVPESLFRAPKDAVRGFLQGLFSADGCVARSEGRHNRYVGLGSASLTLVREVQQLLFGFGVYGRIYDMKNHDSRKFEYVSKKGERKTYVSRDHYDLRVLAQNVPGFHARVNFADMTKRARLEDLVETKDFYFKPPVATLVSRVAEAAEPVYNLTEPLHHTYNANGAIVANCSEFVFLDETSCNLASVNLMKFYDDALGFDVEAYRHANRVVFIAQEIGVDLFSYPSKTIAEMTHKTRPLGLGYANLGTLLMCMGLPYNGPEGRAVAGAITSLMHGQAFLTSAEMAKGKGAFPLYNQNRQPMLNVMQMHREAAYNVKATGSPIPNQMPGKRPEKWFDAIADAACQVWDQAVEEGKKHGYRNSQATVLAPTGTIGLLMDCDTTGVEPEFSLVKWKKLAGGGYFQIINQSVPRALRNLGYSDKEVGDIEAHVVGRKDAKGVVVEPGKETVEGAPHLKPDHYAVFDCANRCGDGVRYIHPDGHLHMMAAVQPFLSGAISKTVNLPSDVNVNDIAKTYELGWKLGLKAVALYRDGCKASQPLSTKKAKSVAETDAATKADAPKGPKWGEMVRLPKFTDNIIKREVTVMDQKLGSVKVHVLFREDPRGRLMEIFLTVGKNGSSTHELCRDLGIAWSKQLRLGLSSRDLALDLLNEHGSVQGMTDHPLIKSCNSVKDLIGKLILYEYHGKTDFLNPELLQTYQESLDYVAPRFRVVEELDALRRLKEDRKEKPLTIFVDPKPASEGVDPNELAAKFMGDAPDCDVCGYKTVRNAACYKCLNCGNSMGCS